jgi:hypothetical protein
MDSKYLNPEAAKEKAETEDRLSQSEFDFKKSLGQLEKSEVTGLYYERLPDGSIKVF